MPRGKPRPKFNEVRPAEGGYDIKDTSFNPMSVPKMGAVEEDAVEDDGYDGALDLGKPISEVKVEFDKFDDTIEKRAKLWGRDQYEVLIFPRELLMHKFADNRGMLSLPKVVKSEWFQTQLKRYGFVRHWSFRKDEGDRVLLPFEDEANPVDAYSVWQRL